MNATDERREGDSTAVVATLTLNPTIDISTDVDQVMPEHKLRCARPKFEPGGGGLNVSRAIRKMGGDSVALWTRGGHIGNHLGRLLGDEGIVSQPIPIQGMTRENWIVYEQSGDRQFRFCMPGPELSASEVEACLDAVAGVDPPPRILVLSGSLPEGVEPDLYARFARAAPKDCRVILDTSREPLQRSLCERLFLIKPNIRELGQLLGREVESDEQIEAGSRELIEAGKTQAVVTSLGSGGAVLVTADDFRHVRSPTVPIRSKVGAGDSMVAGIALALARGNTLEEAVCYGVAAGAAAVMTPGTELCRGEDVERLFETTREAVRG